MKNLMIYVILINFLNVIVCAEDKLAINIPANEKLKFYPDGRRAHYKEGEKITFYGWYTTRSDPEYLFNGQPVKQSKNIRFATISNENLLIISKLEERHTGLYQFYHRQSNLSDEIYLYVRSSNVFVPSESSKLFCDYSSCTVPCRLTNFDDEPYVRLYLEEILQSNTYDSRVGYVVNRTQLNSKLVNAKCVLGNQTVHYSIELRDVFPGNWNLQLNTTNPWPNINDTVLFQCSLNCNTSYPCDSLNKVDISLKLENSGSLTSEESCSIDSSREARLIAQRYAMVRQKEFLLHFSHECRGKFTCEVLNQASNRTFNRKSSIYLDQFELIWRSDAVVETTVGKEKEMIGAVFESNEEGPDVFIVWSRTSEQLSCSVISCGFETKHKKLASFHTNNRTINISYGVERDEPAWHQYTAEIYKRGSNYSIQAVQFDINVRASTDLKTNCSSLQLLLEPTICQFTCISSKPNMLTFSELKSNILKQIPPSSVEMKTGKFHHLAIYVTNITRTTSIICNSSSNVSNEAKLLKLDCVEKMYSVGPSFDNENPQVIYKGDNVNIVSGIAESTQSFWLQHIGNLSTKSLPNLEYAKISWRKYHSATEQKFSLFNSKGENLTTIHIPAAREIIPPFNSTELVVYYTESVLFITCPTDGTPIIYNWMKNGVIIEDEQRRTLFLNLSDPFGLYQCCGTNRKGWKCSSIDVKPPPILSTYQAQAIGAVLVVIVFVLLGVLAYFIYKFITEKKVIILNGEQGAGKTTMLNMFTNCLRVEEYSMLKKNNISFASRFDFKYFGLKKEVNLTSDPKLLFGDGVENNEDNASATRDSRCTRPVRYNNHQFVMADVPGHEGASRDGMEHDDYDRLMQNWEQLLTGFWHAGIRNVHCLALVINGGVLSTNGKHGTKYLLTQLPKDSAANFKLILTKNSDTNGITLEEFFKQFNVADEDRKAMYRKTIAMDNNILPDLVVKCIEKNHYDTIRKQCVISTKPEMNNYVKFFDIQKGSADMLSEIAKSANQTMSADDFERRRVAATQLLESIAENYNLSRTSFLELLDEVNTYKPLRLRKLWLIYTNNQAIALLWKLVERVELDVEDASNYQTQLLKDIIVLSRNNKTLLPYKPKLNNQATAFLSKLAEMVKQLDVEGGDSYRTELLKHIDDIRQNNKTLLRYNQENIVNENLPQLKSEAADEPQHSSDQKEITNLKEAEVRDNVISQISDERKAEDELLTEEEEGPSGFCMIELEKKDSTLSCVEEKVNECAEKVKEVKSYVTSFNEDTRVDSDSKEAQAQIDNNVQSAPMSAERLPFLDISTQPEPSVANATKAHTVAKQASYLLSLLLRFLIGIPDFFCTLYRWWWVERRQDNKLKAEQRQTKRILQKHRKYIEENYRAFRELDDSKIQLKELECKIMEPKKQGCAR